jgi:hypothetical protein
MSNTATPPPKREIKGAGRALLFGAGAALILFILAVILGGISVASGIRHIKKYTSKEATIFHYPETKQNYNSTLTKIGDALKIAAQNKSSDLVLTANDLNSLLAHDPSFKEFKAYCRVDKVAADAIYMDLSYPISKLKWAKWTDSEGEFLNGKALFTGRLKKDHFYLEFNQIQHDGEKIMLDTIESLKEINFLTIWPESKIYQNELKLIRGIKLEEGTITLTIAPFPEDD